MFSLLPENVTKMDFDTIVTDAALQECFSYKILEEKVLLDRRGKLKKALKSKVAGYSKLGTLGMVPAKRVPTKKIIPTPREDVAPVASMVPSFAPGLDDEASEAPLVLKPSTQQEEAAQLTSGVPRGALV